MNIDTYGRGQMEDALWRSFARGRFKPGAGIPQRFRTRIKRLMEIDRDLDFGSAEMPPETPFAFAAPPNPQTGEAAYAPIDAFCLALALDLIDAGFNQKEVVFFVRYTRPKLERRFAEIPDSPSLLSRRRVRASQYPDWPSYNDGNGDWVDARVFLVFGQVELTEAFETLHRRQGPFFLQPVFCLGVEALGTHIADITPYHQRSAMVIEIASTAQAIRSGLRDAPLIRRGRPPNS